MNLDLLPLGWVHLLASLTKNYDAVRIAERVIRRAAQNCGTAFG
jgi:hypothetical protein